MDVLYVVGSGSTHDNEELRYSLRSLARYGKGLGRVYIVGVCPEWVNTDVVTHIPCDDPYDQKAKNILHKVLCAIDNSDLPNEFLMSSDDIFHVSQQDLNNYPYYHKKWSYCRVKAMYSRISDMVRTTEHIEAFEEIQLSS